MLRFIFFFIIGPCCFSYLYIVILFPNSSPFGLLFCPLYSFFAAFFFSIVGIVLFYVHFFLSLRFFLFCTVLPSLVVIKPQNAIFV